MLGKLKPDAMLGLIDLVFRSIPFEVGRRPEPSSGMYKIPYFYMAEKAL
jgi:hypothetical protein